MMLRALFLLAAFSSAPAAAAEWVHCSDDGGAASFDYLAGDQAGPFTVSALTITAGEKVWASDPANGPGDPVSTGQAFSDTATVRIDAVDKDFYKIAELRLFKTTEGTSHILAGTMRLVGQGVWAVSCSASQ